MAETYDAEAAEALSKEAQKLKIPEAVPIYEQLLSTYPKSAKLWKHYVEAHMAMNDDEAAKEIFRRCLLNCLHVPLWRCYINFIKKANEKKGSEGQEETRKAFVFMLNYVGDDITSGSLWLEYITFLKSMVVQTTEQESRRLSAVRKVYQKAVVTPTDCVEELWREYESFEYDKGVLSEYQHKHNRARDVYLELKKFGYDIDWDMLAAPPSGSSKQEVQHVAWKRFLEYEKGNPLRLEAGSANKRIAFVFEQCLMYLYHYPDMWHDYAFWHAKSGLVDSAIKVINRALEAIPNSELLKSAHAQLGKKDSGILLGDGTNSVAPKSLNEPVKVAFTAPTALLAFIADLPAVYGPSPDVDFILSICLQSNIPAGQTLKSSPSRGHTGQNNSSKKTITRDKQSRKRRNADRDGDEDTASVKRQPVPKDAFMIRQLLKNREARTSSQSGSSSFGSASSSERSRSTG